MNKKNGDTSIQLALVEGLATGAKLRDSHMLQVTPLGMDFHEGMTVERWLAALGLIRQMRAMSTLYLADALVFGRRKFGEATVAGAMGQMELDLMEATRAVAIGTLDRGCRLAGVSSEHYYVLAKAGLSAAEQARWAGLAVEHSLSATELAVSIKSDEVQKAKGGTRRGLVTIEGIEVLFSTWWRQVEETPVAQWDDARARAAWKSLEGPTRVGLAIAKRLGLDVEGGGK